MQQEFKPLVEDAEYRCQTYFAERLTAAYLHGSIDKHDAVPGISDLDYFLIVADELQEKDRLWLRETEAALQLRYSMVNGVHLTAHSVEMLKGDSFALFALKYNATLRIGTDIDKLPALSDCEIPLPDKHMARSRLEFAKKCYEDALKQLQPACTGEIPEDTYYAARKYARYFVVIEGAYFLMSQNRFRSFAKEDVLMGLRETCIGYGHFLDMTEAVLQNPIKAGIASEHFLREAQPFMKWIFERIEASEL